MSNELVLVSNYEKTLEILDSQILNKEKQLLKTKPKDLNIIKLNKIFHITEFEKYNDYNNLNKIDNKQEKSKNINNDLNGNNIVNNQSLYKKDQSKIQNIDSLNNNINNNLDQNNEINNCENKNNILENKCNSHNKYTFTKKLPIQISLLSHPNIESYKNRNPSTLWKNNILFKIYSIIKKIYHHKQHEYTQKDPIYFKNLILISLKEIGINNLSIEAIDAKVINFFEENGELDSSQVVSERVLRKNLNRYKLNKNDINDVTYNMLLFLFIYFVKKLEDDMKIANLYPSGFKKKQHLITIINKFNNWNKNEFLISKKINTNSINQFINNLKKQNPREIETIINLCLCRFTKLN
ncbi:hypothetical protein IOLA_029 [uncultured bacterium]|uniref:Uncharacterized protein n=1 Tax=uncultured microorganism TaxID=358574 RepID=A0A077JGF7_9ZZZZ|nr:hypothetical protein [uncultured microorganism]BCL65661.1 hypothetical protein IOLA_029 [uncultured bacterium]